MWCSSSPTSKSRGIALKLLHLILWEETNMSVSCWKSDKHETQHWTCLCSGNIPIVRRVQFSAPQMGREISSRFNIHKLPCVHVNRVWKASQAKQINMRSPLGKALQTAWQTRKLNSLIILRLEKWSLPSSPTAARTKSKALQGDDGALQGNHWTQELTQSKQSDRKEEVEEMLTLQDGHILQAWDMCWAWG